LFACLLTASPETFFDQARTPNRAISDRNIPGAGTKFRLRNATLVIEVKRFVTVFRELAGNFLAVKSAFRRRAHPAIYHRTAAEYHRTAAGEIFGTKLER
jgi:hypothetical protein